jgi:hypothetical protein
MSLQLVESSRRQTPAAFEIGDELVTLEPDEPFAACWGIESL